MTNSHGCYQSDFNPRPRKEGDKKICNELKLDFISIHALAKRATQKNLQRIKVRFYFNPRPRKEGDLQSLVTVTLHHLFQSTPSQRGRRPQTCLKRRPYTISIHALAKRATDYDKKLMAVEAISIHALAKRAT